MDYDKVGCIVVVPCPGGFIGLDCAKGRGKILPGGKWTPEDRTYREAAAREFFEETGLTINPETLEYVWNGPDGFGYDTFAYLGKLVNVKGEPINSTEGRVEIVEEKDLRLSKYAAWYDTFFQVLTERILSKWDVSSKTIQEIVYGYNIGRYALVG